MITDNRTEARHDNLFDAVRFIAASAVIFSHSFTLAGYPREPLERELNGYSLGAVSVLTFFAVSGFLITKSWLDDPRLWTFISKRSLRIGPGLFAAVVAAVFVLGPLVTTVRLVDYFDSTRTWEYLWNLTTIQRRSDLPGVFATNPLPNYVNGSLWTLAPELLCYFAVAVAGVGGLFRFPPAVAAAAAGCWAFANWGPPVTVGIPALDVLVGRPALRMYSTFWLGAVFYLYRTRVPTSATTLVAPVAAVVVSAGTPYLLPVFTLAYPYLVITVASRPTGWWKRRVGKYGDPSYGLYVYAFPIQQATVHLFGSAIGWGRLFAIAYPVTLLLAYVSWHLIERPALRLKPRAAR